MTDDDNRLKALESLSKLDQEFEVLHGMQLHWPADIEIDGLKLVCTCGVCPEQYDVFDAEGKQVGYLRLRHGGFRADVPNCGGQTVYAAEPKGDGIFDDDERQYYLAEAVKAIKDYHAYAKGRNSASLD